VVEHVEREAQRVQVEFGIALGEETKQRLRNEGTLDWFYHDQWVSYRETPDGVEVLAVGLEEIGTLSSGLSPDQRDRMKTKLV
jgi:hypothetical protein